MYVNPGSITASTTFDALFAGRAGGCREDAEWYFVEDDDTLFFHRGVVRFAAQRRRQVTTKVAHGNEFNPTLAKKGWFTGGSGVALSRGMAEAAETRRAASGFRDVLAAGFKWCNCFDVPFMRGLEWVGMRPFHAPNLFLDSCLDCDEGRRLVEDTPVVGCHGATIFREENPHPKNKNGDPYAETKQSLSYRQIQAFRSMGFEERRTYFRERVRAHEKVAEIDRVDRVVLLGRPRDRIWGGRERFTHPLRQPPPPPAASSASAAAAAAATATGTAPTPALAGRLARVPS